MENTPKFRKDGKIKWYRTEVDPKLMSDLMRCSDWHGLRQALGHIGMWITTGTIAYATFLNLNDRNWQWMTPLLLLAMFAHGTVGSFMGGTACHELSHKTPFKTKSINEFFLKFFAFFSWWDQVWFRPSHIRHHQVTVYHEYDGEVVLPHKLSFKDWQFWLGLFAWNPLSTWYTLRIYYMRATGRMDSDWYEFVMPDSNEKLRRDHRNWARYTLIGHAVLATIFIATGNWFLIFIFNLGTQYCSWLSFLCWVPQHFGMCPDVPDHRLSCRTFTCSWLPAFLYWNMQYHVEHHMFPAVPFYNLPRLHKAIEYDLPHTHHGFRALWREVLEIHRLQETNPNYLRLPTLPGSKGGSADDSQLEREAALR